MRCPNCEALIDVLDLCQDCIDSAAKKVVVKELTTHCKAGHEFTPENTAYRCDSGKRVDGGRYSRRYCMTCRRAQDAARKIADRDRKRAAYQNSKGIG